LSLIKPLEVIVSSQRYYAGDKSTSLVAVLLCWQIYRLVFVLAIYFSMFVNRDSNEIFSPSITVNLKCDITEVLLEDLSQ